MKDAYSSLLNYSFRLLTRKSYTTYEISQRLKRRIKKIALPEGDVVMAKVMARLVELGFLNDDKILDNFFQFHLPAKPQGKFKFLNTMRTRGINREKAEQQWEKHDVSEKELARDFLSRKSNQLKKYSSPAERKQKIARLLASRGFSADVVWDVVSDQAML